jgi:hypothetical protein
MAMEHSAASETISGSGIIVYLQEELTDARLRCEQLKKYIAEAVKLIQASEHRDHFHEVAGHLLHGIPDTLFKLDKALSATALAATRLDYESLKQALKPEKAEELERVLEDARITHPQRRSNMGPKDVAAALNSMADTMESTGHFPLADAVNMVAVLEEKSAQNSRLARIASITSSGKVPPSYIRSMAEAVINFPNRERTAKILRNLVANIVGSQELLSTLNQAGSREEVMDGFKKENPDLTDEQLEEIADQWEKNKDVVKDKQASDKTAEAAPHVENDLKSVVNKLDAAGTAVRELQDAFTKFTKDPQRYKPQLNNAQQSSISLVSIGRSLAKLFDSLGGEDIDKQYIDEMRLHMASDKTAGDYSHRSWMSAYGSLAANFVGACGEGLYEYIKTLHGRLEGQGTFDFMGFTSWDYGNVSQKGDEWVIRVWGTDNNAYPGGLQPNLQIMVKFEQDAVHVRLLMGNSTVLLNKKYNDGVTPASIGLICGEVWEKLLTKQVAYGPGEVFASAGEGCSGGCVGCGSVYCSGDCEGGCDCDAPEATVAAGDPEVANWLA